MSSSKSYELVLAQDDNISTLNFSSREFLPEQDCEPSFRTDQPLILRLSGPEDELEVRVRIGTDVVGYLSSQLTAAERNIQSIVGDLFGQTELTIESRSAFEIDAEWNELFPYMIRLEAPRSTTVLYETMIRELEAAHPSLSRDFMGRSVLREATANAVPFDPEFECDELTEQLEAFSVALERIGPAPLTRGRLHVSPQRWRPGDRLDIRATAYAPRMNPEATPQKLLAPRRIARPRYVQSSDVDEHRHMRSAILGLSRRCDRLREGCRRAWQLVAAEERVWGLRRAGSVASVYEERYLPRVERLRRLEAESLALGRGFRSLLKLYPFLEHAGRPRTRLGPTPAFLHRPGYRSFYKSMLESARLARARERKALELRLRRIDLLYEYWTFVSVISLLTEQLGAPDPSSRYRVIDDIYRPELLPGQCFVWSRTDGTVIRAYYEPAIPPEGHREQGPFRWRASLVGAPVRPDVVVLLEPVNSPIRALVLDAKSTLRFDRRSLAAYTDYRTLVHDPETGIQPIRQVFFVHRDPRGLFSTYPGHFEGRRPPYATSVIGAIPLLPGRREDLIYVLESFLAEPESVGPPLDTPAHDPDFDLDSRNTSPSKEEAPESEEDNKEEIDAEFATGAPTSEDEEMQEEIEPGSNPS